jgi:fermentation-respiration switch protein FrsA (DUF1100 family)
VLGAAALLAFPACSSLVERHAFHPDRTYRVDAQRLPEGVRQLFLETDDGERLEAFHVLGTDARGRLALYFHGNGGNVAQRLPELRELAAQGVDVLGLGYRGYGASSGRPSEAGIRRDGRAALAFATRELGYDQRKIFVVGRSLGSVVAIEAAAGRELAGVVLVTPLTCGREFVRARGLGLLSWLAAGTFDNLEGCERLKAPVLVLHGTADEVVPFPMGERLYALAPEPKRLVAIPGGRHDDLERASPRLYWGAIRDFVAAPAATAASR